MHRAACYKLPHKKGGLPDHGGEPKRGGGQFLQLAAQTAQLKLLPFLG